jgi:uncharacterized protein YfdQ (DUF2303 family)
MTESIDLNPIIQLAQDAVCAHPISHAGAEFLFTPGSPTRCPDLKDLAPYAAVPARKKGIIKVFTVDAFNLAISKNLDAGNVVIYADVNPTLPVITAVLNDHGTGGAGWRDFRIVLEFRPTPEWKKWSEINGKMLSQDAFAEHVEENLQDIQMPAGAEMLEIVSKLQITRGLDFKSNMSLATGEVQFQHIETTDAKVGFSQIAIPSEFLLLIAPIHGTHIFQIPARFRFRLNSGKLTLGFKLLRLEDVMAQICTDIMSKIDTNAPNVTLIEGTPG